MGRMTSVKVTLTLECPNNSALHKTHTTAHSHADHHHSNYKTSVSVSPCSFTATLQESLKGEEPIEDEEKQRKRTRKQKAGGEQANDENRGYREKRKRSPLTPLPLLFLSDWLHAVQALMVVSVLFSAISFLLFLYQLYSLRRGGLFYITGLFQIFSGLTVFSASLIYSLHAPEILSDSSLPPAGHFGYCFVVAWLCVPALLISGVLYIHLRKKE
ncbi:uncharacterized protein LOC121307230 [Polyodon spathula]|uniref:uncharacterized protein LOC121307230 n=1 Tax=Polyodon spathula TaxID=7913 RepID=UPI001B7DFA7A|nr:uncharacterized protein LOC121307230 [Polyodon spathula]